MLEPPEPCLVSEILITASGETVLPIPIENMVKEKLPIVSNAVLVGDKAKFLSLLLTLKVTWLSCGVCAPGSGGCIQGFKACFVVLGLARQCVWVLGVVTWVSWGSARWTR